MRIIIHKLAPFLVILSIFIIVSCSKDNNEPEPGITVTTTDFFRDMDENPPRGEIIGTITGTTNIGSVTFSILEQTPAGAFFIDADTGEMKVLDETLFSYEANPVISGKVKVANGTVSATSEVTITLISVENLFYGNVHLKTQEEVNLFGIEQYTGIIGSLIIGEPDEGEVSNISDLSPLASIKLIVNDLRILENQQLITTSGLGITEMEGELAISDNLNLKNINGFDGLTLVGDVNISNSPELNDLSGLNKLTAIEKGLTITGLPSITHLEGFNNLTSIGNLFIEDCAALANIDGLRNLRNITQGDILKISRLPRVTDLNILSNVSGEVDWLEIGDMPALTTLEGLANIKPVEILFVHQTEMLENLNGLEQATTLSGGLFLNENAALNSVQNLSNIVSAKTVRINSNGNLTNLEGLHNITYCNSLEIRNNITLSNFCAFQQLITLAPPLEYMVEGNAYNPTIQNIADGNCSL